MVYLQSEPALQVNDRLQCFSNIEGFNRFCPQLRPEDRSKLVTCHPVVNNEQNCGSFANKIDNKCSTSQTCDHVSYLLFFKIIIISNGYSLIQVRHRFQSIKYSFLDLRPVFELSLGTCYGRVSTYSLGS